MNRWIYEDDEWTWSCPECGFKWNSVIDGLFDDSEYDPADFGMRHCPSCGERLACDD